MLYVNAYSYINEVFEGIEKLITFELAKALISITCKLEFDGNSFFLRFLQLKNAQIIETFNGIKISLIFVCTNGYSSIVCKLEFSGISILSNFLHSVNEFQN